MYFSKVLSTQIEDRIDAKYYDPKLVALVQSALDRNLKVMSAGEATERLKKGIFSIKASEYRDTGVPFLRVSDIRRLSIDTKELVYISEERNSKDAETCMKPGNLIVTKSGTVGTVTFVPKWIEKCNISQDLIGVWLKKEFNPCFVSFFLASKWGRLQLDRVKTQQNQPHLTLENLRRVKIFLPDDKQIEEIALKVEQASDKDGVALGLIRRANSIVTNTVDVGVNRITRSNLYSVLSTDIGDFLGPRFYYPLYVNSIKKLKAKFPTVFLGDVADVKRGTEVGSKNYKRFLEKKETDIPFVRTSDIVNYEIDNSPDYYIAPEVASVSTQDSREQDIVMTKDGKIGFSAMVTNEDRCILASGLARIRLKEESRLDAEYVFSVISTWIGLFQAQQRAVVSSTIPHLSEPRLKEIEIPILPDKSQKEITELVKKAYELKSAKKKLMVEAERMLNSIYS